MAAKDFINWLNEKTELNEMAIDRKKAEQIISTLSDEIFQHLIKVLYWEDKLNYQKHLNDIDTWLIKVDKIEIKPNSKKLKEKDYFEWLYNEQNGSEKQLSKSIKFLSKNYGKLPRTEISDIELFNKLKTIYVDLSKDLSQDKFDSIKKYL